MDTASGVRQVFTNLASRTGPFAVMNDGTVLAAPFSVAMQPGDSPAGSFRRLLAANGSRRSCQGSSSVQAVGDLSSSANSPVPA